MSNNTHLTTWVSRDVKERFATHARREGLSESALLKRLVGSLVGIGVTQEIETVDPTEPLPASGRISVRLRDEDLLLLRERSKARGLPASTYISFLIRSHLRRLAPLPDVELKVLKESIAELSAIGRNLNQFARAANLGEQIAGPSTKDLQALLRACIGLRDHTKSLVNRNLESWEAGHETAHS